MSFWNNSLEALSFPKFFLERFIQVGLDIFSVGRKDHIFFAASLVILAVISVSGSWVQFHSLEWSLVTTPLGLVYSLLFDMTSLGYLFSQASSFRGSFVQVLFSIFASLTGLVYIMFRGGRFPEVEFV